MFAGDNDATARIDEHFTRFAVHFHRLTTERDNARASIRAADADKQPEKRQGNLNHFCMVVDRQDFSGIVDYLAHHGVTVHEGPISRWGARGRATSVYLLDPDGNEVEIRCY